MINISFPDNTIKQFKKGITGGELVESISNSLVKKALFIKVDNNDYDLSRSIDADCEVRIITIDDPEGIELLRHDTAHILAEAIKELYPEAQIAIGPSIKDGFYYDILYKDSISEKDFKIIEDKMRELINRNQPFIREVWKYDKAINYFKSIGENYKSEILKALPNNEQISVYKQGNFIDLCKGPHAPSTGYLKHFKLMKIAGAYWRGDNKNEMLQRIYGTAWPTSKQLDDYIYMLEEAEKRDHRKLGKELDLFHIQREAPGMIFWHPKGWTIYNIIEKYIRKKQKNNGYKEVKTPSLVDKKLWDKSGHWEKFGDNMFISNADGKLMALKPMNCPCHVQIFNQGMKSYRDLPYRIAEFGSCHRYEPSGALHGIMRVRNFVQDDAHIFCTEEQITNETVNFTKLLFEVYKDFGFKNIKIKFSDRPDVRAGSDEVWDKSESSLKYAIKEAGLKYEMNHGEGAFYGPKLEFVLKDAIGREWQCGTLQVDFVLPERLNVNYIDVNNLKKRPVILHRVIIGSFERFIGILIEEYAGKFPLWLSPIQVGIVTVSSELYDYANSIQNILEEAGIRCEIDDSDEKINYKIRSMSYKKIPLIATIGRKEKESGKLSIRRLGNKNLELFKIEELIGMIHDGDINT